jgi:hypothetical protein
MVVDWGATAKRTGVKRMLDTKPEIVLLGDAAVLLRGKPPTSNEEPERSDSATYDLDE